MPDSPPLTALQARLLAETVPAIDDALSATLDGGRAALQDRNWAGAIAAGQNAVAAAPDRFETHLLLGNACCAASWPRPSPSISGRSRWRRI